MKKSRLFAGTAFGTFLLCAPAALAQTVTPIQGISKTAGGQAGTVAQAMKKKIPLKSTFAASHISKAEIEQASPVSTFESILNTEPSIRATSAGPLGTEQNITFRGFNSAQFTQTFDGIAINDIFNAGASNEASVYNDVLINTQEIGGVDLYRGVNNPANNGYNSLAGTINYDPLDPTDTPGASVTGTVGSFNTLQYNALWNTGNFNGFKNVMAFSHGTTSGWLDGDHDRDANFYDAFNQATGSTGKLYGYFIYNENDGEDSYDIPSLIIQQNSPSFQYPKSIYNEPLNDTDYLAILGTTQTIGDFTTVDLKGFFGADNFYRNAYSNPAYQSTGYYVYNKDTSGKSTTYYGYYAQEFGLQPKVTFDLPYNIVTVGGNYTLGHLHSAEFYSSADPVPLATSPDLWNEHDERTLYSIYVQDEIDLLNDTLKITPGVKYLYADTKDVDGTGYDYPTGGSVSGAAHFTSPTAGISYEFVPNTVLYGAYGQNIEFPTIDGFYNAIDADSTHGYTDDIAPVHLQPEHVNDYEAGLRYTNSGLGFGAALGFYLEDFTNTFIDGQTPSGLDTTVNGGSSRYKGVELQLTEDFGDQHINGYDAGDVTAYLSYAYNKAYFTSNFTVSAVGNNNTTEAAVTKGEPVANVPNDDLDLGGSWSLDGWGANVDAQYVTSEYINQLGAGTPTDIKQPAYFLLDLGFSKTVPVQHFGPVQSMKFAFNMDNALNRVYDAYAYANSYSKAKDPAGPYVQTMFSSGTFAGIQEAAPQAFYGSITLNF